MFYTSAIEQVELTHNTEGWVGEEMFIELVILLTITKHDSHNAVLRASITALRHFVFGYDQYQPELLSVFNKRVADAEDYFKGPKSLQNQLPSSLPFIKLNMYLSPLHHYSESVSSTTPTEWIYKGVSAKINIIIMLN